MLRLLAFSCAFLLALPQVAGAQPVSASDLEGLWETDETYFPPSFRLSADGEQLRAELVPSGSPFAEATLRGDSVLLRFRPGVGFRGRVGASGKVISGTWTQGERQATLTLRPAGGARIRPQLPEEPLPYRSEEVSFRAPSDGARITGTLSLPEGNGPHPGVALLAGTGPNARDYEIQGTGHKLFLVLADQLTRRGIAVLRYDKRGTGTSEGTLGLATMSQLAGDAAGALRYLRRHPQVDPERVGLVGHSQGAALLPLAAQSEQGGATFLALLMPPVGPMSERIAEQNPRLLELSGAPPSAVDSARARMQRVTTAAHSKMDSTTLAHTIRPLFAARGDSGAKLEAVVRAHTSPLFRSMMRYDMQEHLGDTTIPLFAAFGGNDLFLLPDENRAALEEAVLGTSSLTLYTGKSLNHWMQPSETGLPQEIGQIETTIAPELIDRLSKWILQQTQP